MDLRDLAPSADAATIRRLAAYSRSSASPGAAAALLRMNTEIDIRHVLPTISVPTLVLHRTDDRDPKIEEGRYIAARVPGAKFVELPGADHLPWIGDAHDVLEVEEFLTGMPLEREADRILVTVLFTDIVGSTERANFPGDAQWRQVLELHHGAARRQLSRFRGREVETAGDGFLASFDGPARAIRRALCDPQ